MVAPLQNLGARVYCFGSRARGDYKKFSDLDLMVDADQDLSGLIGELQEQLTNSDFPYKVDLVEFRHYAEAYKPGYLRERVLVSPRCGDLNAALALLDRIGGEPPQPGDEIL